jgi:UDP-N-acetylglucosamine diphosphorylase/glucosamine-1-phosphate N-acetyltransferase
MLAGAVAHKKNTGHRDLLSGKVYIGKPSRSQTHLFNWAENKSFVFFNEDLLHLNSGKTSDMKVMGMNAQGGNKAGKREGFRTIILAAGKGKRMRSDLAKVLHPVCGVPMLTYCVAAARAAGAGKIVVVIGHQAERIRELFDNDELIFVEQRALLGTGHAVLQAEEAFRDYTGTVVILCGDVPLIRPETVRALYDRHRSGDAALTVLTTIPADPTGYGRVVKTKDGQVLKIVEDRDATPDEKRIREINTGIYCAESPFLFEAVGNLGNRNAQGEYYLTDIVEMASSKGLRVTSILADDPEEVMGINTCEELEMACKRKEGWGQR